MVNRISLNVNAGAYQLSARYQIYIYNKPLTMNISLARSTTLSSPRVKALLKIALDSQKRTMPFIYLAAGILFLFGLLAVLLLQFETKKVQRKPNAARKITILKRLMLCFLWTSTALAFGASFSSTQLAKIIQRTDTSSVGVISQSLIIEAGVGLQVLQWLAASFSFLFSAGVSSIFMVAGDHQTTASKTSLGSGDIPDF